MTTGIQQLFDYVTYQMRVTIDGQNVYLNHFPFLCFAHGDPSLYSDANLAFAPFGHVHSGPKSSSEDRGRLQYLYPTQYDVGVDNNNFTPISWEELNKKIKYQIADWRLKHPRNEH